VIETLRSLRSNDMNEKEWDNCELWKPQGKGRTDLRKEIELNRYLFPP